MDSILSEFYSTENYNASFPDDICGVDPAQKCSRPYKHTLQSNLLPQQIGERGKFSPRNTVKFSFDFSINEPISLTQIAGRGFISR